jgi:hypothetical protein
MRKAEENYIKKEDLIDGETYICLARNFTKGIWVAEKNGFVYLRHKFGQKFKDVEYHWDDGPEGFGTVKPIEIMQKD